MIKRVVYICSLLICFISVSLCGTAQDSTIVKATVDKSRILIGEQIQLTLEADIPESQPIRFFSLDSIPHFEILDAGKIDTANTSGGTTLSRIIRLTGFDSGHFIIPSFYLNDNLSTDSLPIDISFSSFDTAQAYHDIKDIIEVKPPKENKLQWWWFAVGAALILVVVLILVLRKKKQPVVVKTVEIPDPYKIAIEQLSLLQQSKTGVKEYYTKLVDIFRVYVADKKNIHSLQQTSEDLIVQLKALHMQEELFNQLSQSLRLSDWVKFAKYNPSDTDTNHVFNTIKNAIITIEQKQ